MVKMIHLPEIWELMQTYMKPGKWYSIEDIYEIVERYHKLDSEDFELQSPTSSIPKWKRNVRNVLQYRKNKGDLIWDGSANYKLGGDNISKSIKSIAENKIKKDYDNILSKIDETERQTIINQRIGQQVIRKHLLYEYEHKCSMCNIDHPDLLRVSHIILWSENIDTRLDIQNTFLLCGLHDLAFEKGFVVIDDDYNIKINTEAKGVKQILSSITSKKLSLPKSEVYFPNKEYLKIHRDKFLGKLF